MSYPMDSYRNTIPMLQFPIKLDLGAGNYPKDDSFIRMDADPCGGATHIVWDVSRGIPLPNGSVSELYTSHMLEHFIRPDAHLILQECWRVCADGAKVTLKVPHGDTWQGRLICHYSFWYENDMQAMHEWFPHEGHPDYNGNYWDVQRIWREEPCHLIGEFRIIKGKSL